MLRRTVVQNMMKNGSNMARRMIVPHMIQNEEEWSKKRNQNECQEERLFKQEALPKKQIVKKQNFVHNTPTAHNNAHHRTCVCSATFCACTTPSAVV